MKRTEPCSLRAVATPGHPALTACRPPRRAGTTPASGAHADPMQTYHGGPKHETPLHTAGPGERRCRDTANQGCLFPRFDRILEAGQATGILLPRKGPRWVPCGVARGLPGHTEEYGAQALCRSRCGQHDRRARGSRAGRSAVARCASAAFFNKIPEIRGTRFSSLTMSVLTTVHRSN